VDTTKNVEGAAIDPTTILKNCGLKRTLGRVKILEILVGLDRPMTGKELLNRLGTDAVDPASVYRILNAFFELKVVHRIEGADNINRYALNRGEDMHPHFTCRTCGKMKCLTMTTFPHIDIDMDFMEEGYLVERESISLVGLCPGCRV